MTIRKKSSISPKKLILDLTDSQGNAFCILGTAQSLCKKLYPYFLHEDLKGFSSVEEVIDKVIKEMEASDYENLVQVFDKYFGKFVTLLR